MKQSSLFSAVALAGLAAALSACVSNSPSSRLDAALASCLRATGAPGTYVASTATSGAPVIKASAGGTLRGEVLMGACVDARLKPATPAVRVTSAPPATVKPAKGKNLGGLALPTQYPLLPGDPELWNTLTLAQQKRALLFLADGSTIAASMRTD